MERAPPGRIFEIEAGLDGILAKRLGRETHDGTL